MHGRITNHFRPAYEGRAAVAWLVATGYCGLLALVLHGVSQALVSMLALGATMAVLRGYQLCRHWDFKASLVGRPIERLPVATLEAARAQLNGDLWLGWGFRWEPRHAQLAADILKQDRLALYPPPWYLRLRGITEDPLQAKGMRWIQGLERERDVRLPMKALEGHTAMIAITGAIKTTLFRLLVRQLAANGDVVIVLDPKGDTEFKNICRETAQQLQRPFGMFHPAHPTQSFRFDAFASWDRETQVASRIRMILSADEDNNFVSFVWMTVTNIVGCMKRIGQRASISSLLEHVQSQSAAEHLCEQVLQRFLVERVPHFETLIAERAREAEGEARKPRAKGPQLSSPRLTAMIDHFKNDTPSADRPKEITGLIAALESNREWFGKMIITLTPTLTKLSAGDLDGLLSPVYDDIDDERPILTSRKMIEGGYIAYFGLDALSDASVGSAIAAVALADLASTAGEIYNYDIPAAGGEALRRVHVIIDEWGDVVCEPVVHGANKGRGARLTYYLAGQTFSDLVVKLNGNVAMAKRILGNMNNLIVGATNDADTLELIASKLGETDILRYGWSQGAGQKTEDAGLEYSANRGVNVSEQRVELVPGNLIQALPDLEYFAVVNRATVYKGRIPALTLA